MSFLKPTPNWRTKAIVGLASVAILTWIAVSLRPPEPAFLATHGSPQINGTFHPGGSGCDPKYAGNQELDAKQRDACSAATEDHRLAVENVAQVTRSAVAAEQAARQAFHQAEIAWVQTIILLVALGASAWAAVAASNAAKSAGETLSHSRDTAERQLRAYMGMLRPTIVGFFTEEPLHVELMAKNVGQTPAYHFGWLSAITIKDLPFEEELRVEFNESELNDIPVGAGIEIGHSSPSPGTIKIFTPEERAALRAGDKAILLYGEMRYSDIFGKRHSLRYQMIVSPTGQIFAHKKGNFED